MVGWGFHKRPRGPPEEYASDDPEMPDMSRRAPIPAWARNDPEYVPPNTPRGYEGCWEKPPPFDAVRALEGVLKVLVVEHGAGGAIPTKHHVAERGQSWDNWWLSLLKKRQYGRLCIPGRMARRAMESWASEHWPRMCNGWRTQPDLFFESLLHKICTEAHIDWERINSGGYGTWK